MFYTVDRSIFHEPVTTRVTSPPSRVWRIDCFAETPPAEKVRELLFLDLFPEKLAFGENTAYMYIPGIYSRGHSRAIFWKRSPGSQPPSAISIPEQAGDDDQGDSCADGEALKARYFVIVDPGL
jgi:hypothetical protein